MEENGIKRRGFASLSPERRKEIASRGGKKVSQNKEFMREIGRKGGSARPKSERARPEQTQQEQQSSEAQ